MSFLVLQISRWSEREREREKERERERERKLVAALAFDSLFIAATIGCWGFVLVLDW